MATRRSARATSRPVSSIASSANPDGLSSPRVTTRRAGSAQLPAVNVRSSTAYGTNTVPALMTRAPQPQTQQLNDYLGNILDPVREEESTITVKPKGRQKKAPSIAQNAADSPDLPKLPTRKVRKSTATRAQASSSQFEATPQRNGNDIDADADRTFTVESNVFSGAAFDTSSISQPSPVAHIQQLKPATNGRPAVPQTQIQQQPQISSQRMSSIPQDATGRNRRLSEVGQPVIGLTYDEFVATHLSKLNRAWKHAKKIFRKYWPWILAAMVTFLAYFGRGSSRNAEELPYQSYGFDLRHNIGQFIPNWVAHPLESFSPDIVQNLQSGLRTSDYKIAILRKQADIDSEAIKKIEKALPDFVATKKDPKGNLQIPKEFWQALRDKIRTDGDLIPSVVGPISGKPSAGAQISLKEFDRKAGKLWEKFLADNRAKIAAWSASDIDKRFPDLFKKNILASKAEIIDMIHRNWKDNQDELRKELASVSKQLEKANQQIMKLQDEPASMNKDELKAIIKGQIKSIIPVGQLEALAKLNIKGNINYGLTKVNYFSRGTGAVVNIPVTSPNYVFPSMNKWFFQKATQWAIGNPIPIANPPEAALKSWEEHGDCWCAPANDKDGRGPALGVIMGSKIYPEEVVVEHISPGASLEPGAAPREMELLANIGDFSTYDALIKMSEDLFPEESNSDGYNFNYVRIATWTYDIESEDNIQAFPIQLDLKSYGISTDKLVVRSKNNWGGGKVDYTCLYRVRIHGENSKTP
ncbi:hypothetical protein BGZ60DRAFT_249419 [Tricladium varicosporioides]|nr:hypothetical protein BGZ60DRAFT_249419 [Hymenoscyphus varicosporioides]